MLEYDFKCIACGVVTLLVMDPEETAEELDAYCVRCKGNVPHRRIYSGPAIGRGSNGEPFRPSL